MIDFLIDLARRTNHRFMVRLVKGALGRGDQARPVDGLPGYPVYTQGLHRCGLSRLRQEAVVTQDAIYPQFATHNAYSLAAVFNLASGKDYEFQCLHGMGETLYDKWWRRTS